MGRKIDTKYRLLSYAGMATSLGAVALIGVIVDARWQNLLITSLLWGVVGMGWLLVLRVGEFSLGQAAFLAIGAYSSVVLVMKAGLPFWLAWPASGLISALFSYCLGFVVLRLKGLYFSVITFAFAEVVRIVISQWTFLGSQMGFWGIPTPEPVGPIDFSARYHFLWLSIFLFVVCALVVWRLDRSNIGRMYRSIANNEPLAQSVGVSPRFYKVVAWMTSCFFTGLAGALNAHYLTIIGPDGFTLWHSLFAQLVAIVGGLGNIVGGPLLGAFVLTVAGDYLDSMLGLRTLFYGILLVVLMLFAPLGMMGLLTKSLTRLHSNFLFNGTRTNADKSG